MTDNEESISNRGESNPEKASGGADARRRRGRRGGRGRRKPAARETVGTESSKTAHPSQSADSAPTGTGGEESKPLLEKVRRLTERVTQSKSGTSGSAIQQALDEVMAIIEALRQAVEQMEEVLELVEIAERQKTADEREIESLRRALRQVQDRSPERPRDSHSYRERKEQRGASQRRPARPHPSSTPVARPEPPESQPEVDSGDIEPPDGSADENPDNAT